MSGLILASVVEGALAAEWSGDVALEARGFFSEATAPAQRDVQVSVAFEPEFYHAWNAGDDSLLFVPFLRLDSADAERTHTDIRELSYLHVGRRYEFRAGIRKVFWGVTESNHLVDFINQVDFVENIDLEDRLGQPMLNLALIEDFGTIDLFVLPYFRERSFPGRRGRLRPIPRVDTDRERYEAEAGRNHLDLAARYSHYFGPFDLGLAHFYGTDRVPILEPIVAGGALVLRPYYELVHRTSLDLQGTFGNWLWKLEAVREAGGESTLYAAVGGFEYTFVGAFGTFADIGVLAELHYADEITAAAPFDEDLFLGTRLALNDAASMQLLAGLVRDLEAGGTFWNVEASRRLGQRYTLSLEMRLLTGDIRPADPFFAFRNDDYLQLEIARYF